MACPLVPLKSGMMWRVLSLTPPVPQWGRQPCQRDGDGVGAHGHPPGTACRGDGALLFPEKTLAP